MTGKKYYYIAFLAPILLPLFVGIFDSLIGFFTGTDGLGVYSGFFFTTLLFGGIPYVVFLIGFYFWADGKTGKQIHSASYVVPIIYLIPLYIFWTGFYMLTNPEDVGNFFSFLVSSELWKGYYMISKIALYVAYGYIILFNIIYWILKLSGKLVDEQKKAKI